MHSMLYLISTLLLSGIFTASHDGVYYMFPGDPYVLELSAINDELRLSKTSPNHVEISHKDPFTQQWSEPRPLLRNDYSGQNYKSVDLNNNGYNHTEHMGHQTWGNDYNYAQQPATQYSFGTTSGNGGGNMTEPLTFGSNQQNYTQNYPQQMAYNPGVYMGYSEPMTQLYTTPEMANQPLGNNAMNFGLIGVDTAQKPTQMPVMGMENTQNPIPIVAVGENTVKDSKLPADSANATSGKEQSGSDKNKKSDKKDDNKDSDSKKNTSSNKPKKKNAAGDVLLLSYLVSAIAACVMTVIV